MNCNKVEGSKTITNSGRNSSGNLVYNIEAANARIISEEDTIKSNSSRQCE